MRKILLGIILIVGLSFPLALTTSCETEENYYTNTTREECGYIYALTYDAYNYYITFTDGRYYIVPYSTWYYSYIGQYKCLTITN